MEFPRFVYTCPGPFERQGGTYGQHLVKSQAEFDVAVKTGFNATLPGAIEDHAKKMADAESADLAAQAASSTTSGPGKKKAAAKAGNKAIPAAQGTAGGGNGGGNAP